MAKSSEIVLHSGATFDFLNPRSSKFTIDDVAHGLANICRYSGQCTRFYSVAEHSLLVSQLSRGSGLELVALLHDAAEAFLGDVTGPLKQLLPEYKVIESSVQRAILARFDLPEQPSPVVKKTELRVAAAEQAQIMPPGTDQWAREAGIEPAPIVVKHLAPREAKALFLQRFRELQ